MTRGIGTQENLYAPLLLPCGAFVSPRLRSAVCQACYGRHRCRCARGTGMPCDAGTHYTPGGQRAHANARVNRGFVDINHGRRGISNAR
jgi:hypothetical protein